MNKTFAPLMPETWKKNPNEWLSDYDIKQVMKQYEEAYSCFEFMGPSPIDFDSPIGNGYGCVEKELCQFNLKDQIDRKKTKIGIIYNTDPHTKSGEHWISLFINIKKEFIYFFDSAGNKIPDEIMVFVNRVIEQGKKMKNPILLKFDQNYPVEHQYGGTECGVYSLYFIIHMLEDKHTKEFFKTHILPDEYIEKYRQIYYNKEL
jgi:hypothetical protein